MHYCHGRAQAIERGHCIFLRPERSQLSHLQLKNVFVVYNDKKVLLHLSSFHYLC